MAKGPLYTTPIDSSNEPNVKDCGCQCRCSNQTTEERDTGTLPPEYPQSQDETLNLRRAVDALRSELADLRLRVSPPSPAQNEPRGYLKRGSSVYCTSFAVNAWAVDNHEQVKLILNQNNILTIIDAVTPVVYNHDRRAAWSHSFSFPIPLLPNSAVAATNSFLPKNVIPDPDASSDRGRNVQRVFYFDSNGILREWLLSQTPTWWQSSTLAIENADPRCISAICWGEGGFAEWSLVYMTKEEFVDGEWRGGRLLEVRCSGGATGTWSDATEIQWPHRGGGNEGQGDKSQPEELAPQVSFCALTNEDGTDRRIFYLNRTSNRRNMQFHSLKWGGRTHNGWVQETPPSEGVLDVPSTNTTTCFSGLYVASGKDGIRIHFHDGHSIKDWSSKPSVNKGQWKMNEICTNNTSPGALMASTDILKGQHYQRFIFSLFEGKVTQTTFINGHGWSVKPIVIDRI